MNSYTSDIEWTIGRTARLGPSTYRIGDRIIEWPVREKIMQDVVADLLTWQPQAAPSESAVVMVIASRDLSHLTALANKYAKGAQAPEPPSATLPGRGIRLPGQSVPGHEPVAVDEVVEEEDEERICNHCGQAVPNGQHMFAVRSRHEELSGTLLTVCSGCRPWYADSPGLATDDRHLVACTGCNGTFLATTEDLVTSSDGSLAVMFCGPCRARFQDTIDRRDRAAVRDVNSDGRQLGPRQFTCAQCSGEFNTTVYIRSVMGLGSITLCRGCYQMPALSNHAAAQARPVSSPPVDTPRIECVSCNQPATMFYKAGNVPIPVCVRCNMNDQTPSRYYDLLFNENEVGQSYLVETPVANPEGYDAHCDMCEVELAEGYPYVERETNTRFILCLGCANRVMTNISLGGDGNQWWVTRQATLAEGAAEMLNDAMAPLDQEPPTHVGGNARALQAARGWIGHPAITITNLVPNSTVKVFLEDYSQPLYTHNINESTVHVHRFTWQDHDRQAFFAIEHPDYSPYSFTMDEQESNQTFFAQQVLLIPQEGSDG